MIELYKFGTLREESYEEPYVFPNSWARETTSGPERLTIAPSSAQVQLLEALCELIPGPYWVLYVLAVPRNEALAGRYQSATPWETSQLRNFLKTYRDFLEQDGRHNLWIASASSGDLLVYDRHNVIYAYGPLAAYLPMLNSHGLTEASEIRFPDPHVHKYNVEFDPMQDQLLGEREWVWSPLRTGDRNPGE